MKIHFIISKLSGGGAERVLSLIANGFAKRLNYDLTVITLNKGSEYILDPSIKTISFAEASKIPNHTIRGLYNLSKFYLKKSNRPDLIISFITLTNFIAILIAKLYAIKIIAEEHNSYLRLMKSRERLTNFTRKYLYSKADAITVLTSFDIDYYVKFGANVVVMPNPCTFKPIQKNNTEREKVFLAAGSLDRYNHKGFDNLIHLIAPILKSNPEWVLKIAGDGKEGLTHLTQLVKDHDIEDKVIFTGFISNISDLMYKSSIFILSSRYEGLPMVLLEAMSQGMACVAYNCKTGPSDIINDKLNGILVEDQNMTSMQENILNLINDEALRNALAIEGLKSLEKYDINNVLDQYETVFNKINAGI